MVASVLHEFSCGLNPNDIPIMHRHDYILKFWISFNIIFLDEIRKSKHHLWILYIRISLGIKFQLKLTI